MSMWSLFLCSWRKVRARCMVIHKTSTYSSRIILTRYIWVTKIVNVNASNLTSWGYIYRIYTLEGPSKIGLSWRQRIRPPRLYISSSVKLYICLICPLNSRGSLNTHFSCFIPLILHSSSHLLIRPAHFPMSVSKEQYSLLSDDSLSNERRSSSSEETSRQRFPLVPKRSRWAGPMTLHILFLLIHFAILSIFTILLLKKFTFHICQQPKASEPSAGTGAKDWLIHCNPIRPLSPCCFINTSQHQRMTPYLGG